MNVVEQSTKQLRWRDVKGSVLGIGAILLSLVMSLEWLLGTPNHPIIQAVFWFFPLPFILWAIYRPRWTAACLVALIFWLPGPIDHFWDVPVTFFDTSDLVRYLSLLDLIFLAALFFLSPPANSKIRWHELFTGLLLLILIVLSTANIFWQIGNLDSLRFPALMAGAIFIRLLVVFLVVEKALHNMGDLSRLYIGFLVGNLGLLANSGYQFLTNQTMAGRLKAGTFGNNAFSVLLVTFVVLLEGLKSLVPYRWWRLALTILQMINVVFCLLTGTRTGLLLLMAGFFLFVMIRHRNPWDAVKRFLPWGVFFLIAILLFMQFAATLNITWSDRITAAAKVVLQLADQQVTEKSFSTVNVRLVFWKFAFEKLADSPFFGIGPGQWNFERVSGDHVYLIAPNGLVDSVTDPHNGYVHLAVEFGWPTLIFYLFMVLICIISGWRILVRAKRISRKDPAYRKTLTAFAGIFSASIILLTAEMTNAYITKLHLQLFIGILIFSLLRFDTILRTQFGEPVQQDQQGFLETHNGQ